MMVDEERYPMVYESKELQEWRKKYLKTHNLLQENGISFLNHYVGSTACAPSRASLFTGQYPSLHGVSQTPGAAKGSYDADMFWLDPNTVPTLGDYFRAAGYQTYWKGKWHISIEDILVPGTHEALKSYDPDTGEPDIEVEQMYLQANRLDPYGFSGWIGPEPHGMDPRDSGSSAATGVKGRDTVYAEDVVQLINKLEEGYSDESEPWLIVSSFVNPHDISLAGLLTRLLPSFDLRIDSTAPDIPPAPTATESLDTKPSAQRSYRYTYQKALQPTLDSHFLRKFYYSLIKEVDEEMFKVYQALQNSIFYDNTIVVFTSDHGDLLGAHGGLFQKWHNAYEETIHVPFIIHNPQLFASKKQTSMLTSHVDVLPTLLSLANISVEEVQEKLQLDHSEVHPLVGRDLTPLIDGMEDFDRAHEPIYFMTDDEFSRGLHQETVLGEPYEAVSQPNHVETVITTLKTGQHHREEIWKFSRYFDNPQFWSEPYVEDKVSTIKRTKPLLDHKEVNVSIVSTKTEPVQEEYELYNLTTDPIEEINLAHPDHATSFTKSIQKYLMKMLQQQRETKRLYPTNTNDDECDCRKD